MNLQNRTLKRLPRGVRGQGLVEYALILVLVAVVAIPVLYLGGLAIQRIFGLVNGGVGATVSAPASGGEVVIESATCLADISNNEVGLRVYFRSTVPSEWTTVGSPPKDISITASAESFYQKFNASMTTYTGAHGEEPAIYLDDRGGKTANDKKLEAVYSQGSEHFEYGLQHCPKVIVLQDAAGTGVIAAAPVTVEIRP